MAFKKCHLTYAALGAAMLVGGASTSAHADTRLDVDINVLDIDSTMFSFVDLSGTMLLTDSGSTTVNGVELNDDGSSYDNTQEADVEISITTSAAVAGEAAVTGGTVTVTLTNGDSYVASIVGGTARESLAGGVEYFGVTASGFISDGITSDDDAFAGVDVSAFLPVNGAIGGHILLSETPITSTSKNTDALISAIVPTPTAALAAIPMLGVLGARRRRQQD